MTLAPTSRVALIARRGVAHVTNSGGWVFVAECYRGDITHSHPSEALRTGRLAARNDDRADLVQSVEVAFGANHVAPFAFGNVAGGDGSVAGAHRSYDIANRQSEACEVCSGRR